MGLGDAGEIRGPTHEIEPMDAFVFYASGIVALAASVFVVTRRNPVYSSIFLVLFFSMVSLQFLVLRAPFLAVIQLLVYAGAIMVLFLFVLMLLNLSTEELREDVSPARRWFSAAGSFLLFLLLASAIAKSPTVAQAPGLAAPVTAPPLAAAGETRPIAESLFRLHILPFELTSFLILIAVIGAIYLTKSRGKDGPEAESGRRALSSERLERRDRAVPEPTEKGLATDTVLASEGEERP